MARPAVADVFRAHAESYLAARRVPWREQTILERVATCRTPARGVHAYACPRCPYVIDAFDSCGDRHCPTCQGRERAKWVESMMSRLLPVGYFHSVFTLPAELRPLAYCNKEIVFDLLFASAAGSLITIGRDEKHLGAQVGFTAVLHTWDSRMLLHPHLHCVVPGGGLSQDGTAWVPSRDRFFLPVRVLSKMFRGKFLDGLKRARDKLVFAGSAAKLADEREFDRLVDRLYRKPWCVYCKPPFGGPEVVFKYLAGYTHRIAIADARLVSMEGRQVTFMTRKNSKDGSPPRYEPLTLDAHEFIRRFLLHVLPGGYTRVRHFGLMAPSNVNTKLVLARQLIAAANEPSSASTDSLPPPRPSDQPAPTPETRKVPEAHLCPNCGIPLVRVGPGWRAPERPLACSDDTAVAPPGIDSS